MLASIRSFTNFHEAGNGDHKAATNIPSESTNCTEAALWLFADSRILYQAAVDSLAHLFADSSDSRNSRAVKGESSFYDDLVLCLTTHSVV